MTAPPAQTPGTVTITHIESWAVAITPPEGCQWPVIEGGAGRNDMLPDLILVQVIPGQPLSVSGSGRRLRRDGSVGALRVDAPWVTFEGLPEWAARLAGDALRQHSLNQLAEHAVAPMPGSVRDRLGRTARRVTPVDYPLSALCHQCHEPVQSVSFEAGWAHGSGAVTEGS